MQYNQHLEQVKVYEAGKPIDFVVRELGIPPDEVIKLASNENPNGCSPLVSRRISNMVAKQMPLYPDDHFYELKQALSHHFNITADHFIIGCGSDQVISFCIHSKASLQQKRSKMLISGFTFPMYQIAAQIAGIETIKTPSKTHQMAEFYELYSKHQPDIVFLCVPNNPLGECLSKQEIYDFINCCDKESLIVIDGAYQEYAKYKDSSKYIDPQALIATYDNVVYLGTFSKAYGLGGMRVGYGIGNASIIKTLYKLRPPFNITSLSLKASTIALQDQAFVTKSVADNFIQMHHYEDYFKQKQINYIDSYTNFITALLPQHTDSTKVAQALLQKGIIIRNFATINAIRITIGTTKQNDKVLHILDEVLTI